MPILPDVQRFVEQHSVPELRVPDRDCPECKRTLVATAVYLTSSSTAVWAMQCPTHRTMFGVEVEE